MRSKKTRKKEDIEWKHFGTVSLEKKKMSKKWENLQAINLKWKRRNFTIFFMHTFNEMWCAERIREKERKKNTEFCRKTYFGLKFNQNITSAPTILRRRSTNIIYLKFLCSVGNVSCCCCCCWCCVVVVSHAKIDPFYFYYCRLCSVCAFAFPLSFTSDIY